MEPLTETYQIPDLPPKAELETLRVLRQAAIANRHLAELKGIAKSIPNPAILIDTLSLQEARSSSEIENIVTTQDDVFRAGLSPVSDVSGTAKEVALYRDALNAGYRSLEANQGLLTNNTIIGLFQVLKRTDGGFRKTPGTALFNEATRKIDFVPPQSAVAIEAHMRGLEKFINDDMAPDLDPLIKLAIIHHQFESIHPFPDGNGRIGRIINVLYLVQKGLLDLPILYLSRFINSHKNDYYRLLQLVRDSGEWEEWLLYMLRGIADTAADTVSLIASIRDLMQEYKGIMRTLPGGIYSQDLLNNLFRHPYTRIEFVQRDLGKSRPTAVKYLEALASAGLVVKITSGRNVYFVNTALVSLLSDRPLLDAGRGSSAQA
jgi:Fic family protein